MTIFETAGFQGVRGRKTFFALKIKGIRKYNFTNYLNSKERKLAGSAGQVADKC